LEIDKETLLSSSSGNSGNSGTEASTDPESEKVQALKKKYRKETKKNHILKTALEEEQIAHQLLFKKFSTSQSKIVTLEQDLKLAKTQIQEMENMKMKMSEQERKTTELEAELKALRSQNQHLSKQNEGLKWEVQEREKGLLGEKNQLSAIQDLVKELLGQARGPATPPSEGEGENSEGNRTLVLSEDIGGFLGKGETLRQQNLLLKAQLGKTEKNLEVAEKNDQERRTTVAKLKLKIRRLEEQVELYEHQAKVMADSHETLASHLGEERKRRKLAEGKMARLSSPMKQPSEPGEESVWEFPQFQARKKKISKENPTGASWKEIVSDKIKKTPLSQGEFGQCFLVSEKSETVVIKRHLYKTGLNLAEKRCVELAEW